MSQIKLKSLEAPRPLKTQQLNTRPAFQNAVYEVQSFEELITLTENVANALQVGQSTTESMNILLSNLRKHGPHLEIISKDILDRAFVTFRNASQDERLTIIARMNLLEIIELRAKSWQTSDGIHMYYKHKATDVQSDNNVIDLTMLSTSPPNALSLNQIGLSSIAQTLSPGELIRNSGKFTKPTKIPGKNYSKDEVVIRNADSGKVSPGAKERLVQITGPSEEKINYAKQLIEETIRRNASPQRLEAPQAAGSCSSLASSASDEAIPRAKSMVFSAGGLQMGNFVLNQQYQQQSPYNNSSSVSGGILMNNNNNTKQPRNAAGGQTLLHSLSTNDASLGEYKYTVNVGNHNIKITGECFELVRIAKLVLDDYFSSSEFLASVEAGASYDLSSSNSVSTLPSTISTNIPMSHQLNSGTPFADSGIGLNMMASSSINNSNVPNSKNNNNNNVEIDDDVFIVDCDDLPDSTQLNYNTQQNSKSTPVNGLTRSRRSHFSRKDSTPEGVKEAAVGTNKDASKTIVHKYEYERLVYYAKSPHSWALPKDWARICEMFAPIVRNKDLNDEKNRFDADKYLLFIKTSPKISTNASSAYLSNESRSADSPDPE